MKYLVTRNGQTIGTHTQEELHELARNGKVFVTDIVTPVGTAASFPAAPAPAAAVAPEAAPASDEEYFVQRGSERFGPYSRELFLEYARAGNFGAGDLVWRPGMAIWESLEAVLARIEGRPMPAPAISTASVPQSDNEALKWVVPIGASGFALAASWLAVASLLLLPGPVAVVFGILALRDIKKHPTKSGIARAWLGIVVGTLATLTLIALIVSP